MIVYAPTGAVQPAILNTSQGSPWNVFTFRVRGRLEHRLGARLEVWGILVNTRVGSKSFENLLRDLQLSGKYRQRFLEIPMWIWTNRKKSS